MKNAWGGGEGLWGLSQWVQLYTWSPNKLWRSNSILNLWSEWWAYRDKAESKAKGGIYFHAISEVYVDHQVLAYIPNKFVIFLMLTLIFYCFTFLIWSWWKIFVLIHDKINFMVIFVPPTSKKTLISKLLWLLTNLLSLEPDVNVPVPSVNNKPKNL